MEVFLEVTMQHKKYHAGFMDKMRTQGLNYPNREWGYGRLNLEETFNALLRV